MVNLTEFLMKFNFMLPENLGLIQAPDIILESIISLGRMYWPSHFLHVDAKVSGFVSFSPGSSQNLKWTHFSCQVSKCLRNLSYGLSGFSQLIVQHLTLPGQYTILEAFQQRMSPSNAALRIGIGQSGPDKKWLLGITWHWDCHSTWRHG